MPDREAGSLPRSRRQTSTSPDKLPLILGPRVIHPGEVSSLGTVALDRTDRNEPSAQPFYGSFERHHERNGPRDPIASRNR
jgi:hypothetical protein